MRIFFLLLITCLLSRHVHAADVQFTKKDGYSFAESSLSLNGNSFRLWIYAPLNASPGKACVIVPPAGTPLFLGMNVGEGDQPEHLPYVKSGHYVVTFDILGAKAENATNADVGNAIKQFFAAGAGVDQIPLIITFIKEHLKNVDPKAVYMAGHSSAGTLVLQSSQRVDGLAGVIAYCPIVDIETRIAVKLQAAIKELVPRYKDGLASINPTVGFKKTRCKVFLFGSTGDTNALLADIEAYAQKLQAAKLDVVLMKGSADHYNSMIEQGIPAALKWLTH